MMKVSFRLMLLGFCFWMGSVSATLRDAQLLYEQGKNTQAMAEVDRLLETRPDDAEIRFLKGIIFAENGQSNQAIEVFAGLTQDYPELPEPWNNLAVLFAENGEFDKARESLLAAIQTHPSYSTAHENLGDLYARMAGMAYDQALEQDRGNESARLKLSAVNGLFSAPVTRPVVVAAAEPEPVSVSEPDPVVTRQPEPVVTKEPDPVVARVEPEPEPEPEPVVIEPEPEPEPEPVSVDTTASDVEAVVRNWASAWSSQDVPGYLDKYSPNFRPSNGASYRAWANYRRERLTKPSVIEVGLSNIRVERVNGNTATATFSQKYRSDNYRDEVTKILTLNNDSGVWRITSEESQ